jgi:hypothetical protein
MKSRRHTGNLKQRLPGPNVVADVMAGCGAVERPYIRPAAAEAGHNNAEEPLQ